MYAVQEIKSVQQENRRGLSIAALGRAISQFMDNLILSIEASQLSEEIPFDEKALRRIMLEG